MKTVKMKFRFYLLVTILSWVSANAQLTPGMLTLPTLNMRSASIKMKFSATAVKNAGEVTWHSVNHIKVRRYELEKSADGINFTYVTARPAGANAQSNFSVKDEYLFEGVNYYRLKIVDKNGNFNYSKTV